MNRIDDDKESQIINRHLAEMVVELKSSGFHAEAAVAFVVFGKGTDSFNIATLMNADIPKDMTVEDVRVSILSYAHDKICDLLDELDPRDQTRH